MGEDVAITGCGWVTPFGAGSIDEVLAVLEKTPRDANQPMWRVPEDLRESYGELSRELKQDKGAWMTAIAYDLAIKTAGFEQEQLDPTRTGVTVGCGLAGQLGMIQFAEEVRAKSARFVSPIHFPQTVGNYIAGALARAYGIRGPSVTLANGCASGLDALVEACHVLWRGEADIVAAGGVEPLSDALAEGLAGSKCPGDGIWPVSEGACFFSMERSESAAKRGANVLARIPSQTEDEGGAADIVSVAGLVRCGAVAIEAWVGRCFGASGAAAVAATIGAARGCEVPVCTSDSSMYAVERRMLDDLGPKGSTGNGLVVAQGESGEPTTLTLTLNR